MSKRLVRKAAHALEWIIYKLLDEKQRESIKNMLTENQKQFIKKLLFSGQMQRKRINSIKHRLYNLGFTERGLAELQELCNKSDESYLRRLAAWELALWHANQYSKEGAQKCLELLPYSTYGEKNPARLRQVAIMEAECYDILGEIKTAKQVISKALALEAHPDLYLAAANLEASMTERIEWINKALAFYGSMPISINPSADRLPYDRLTQGDKIKDEVLNLKDTPKVSVIMPVYNAVDVIHTSLASMLNQTWRNLEILVVDDCSTDDTASIVKQFAQKDPRIRLITAASNGGAYVARNLALRKATGDFVTVNDADDWSHPEKIEKQVHHLLENKEVIGNTSQQARATNELKFFRRGRPGSYIFSNMSSFMFRRKEVMDAIGYWDSVRFAADSEFIKRIRKVFGEKAVVEMPTGPLSFTRQTDTSLTGNQAFGYHGYKMGARKEYDESHNYFHQTAECLKYAFPQESRPFAVPEPMWPKREKKNDGYRTFDIVVVSDFRLDQRLLKLNLQEIQAHKRINRRIGLIQMSQYDVSPDRTMHDKMRELIDGNQVQMLVFGEKIACDTLVVTHLPALQEKQQFIPEVKARNIHVVVNQLPRSYDLKQCEKHLIDYFGDSGLWHPIDSSLRKELQDNHRHELKSITVANEDWGGLAFEEA